MARLRLAQNNRFGGLAAVGLAVLAGLGVWLPLPWPLHLAAAAFLALFLPGWLLLQAIGFTGEDRLEQLGLAVGLSYALTTLLALGVLYGSGSLSTLSVAGALIVGSLLLGLAGFWRLSRATVSRPLTRLDGVAFLIPVVTAVFFSFVNLGYADYWNDEMNGLLRAISIIGGRPETLFEHTKGPVEILLPAVFGLLSGGFTPFEARLPFALAHVVGIGSYYLAGRCLFGAKVGLLAALLLALNGLYLAFGRLVQYQAVVFLMTALVLLLAYRFYRGAGGLHPRRDAKRHLALAGLLTGVGLLAHYDMLAVLPPLVYLVWQRYGRRWPAWRADWPILAGAALLFLAVTAAFYWPFLRHPHLSQTSSYLARIVGPTDWPSNNFDELYSFAVLYNSTYYVAFIAVLGALPLANDLFKLLRDQWQKPPVGGWVGLTLVLSLLAFLFNWAAAIPLIICTSVLVLLIVFSAASVELKTIYVWVGASFLGYVFFVDHPRTHLQIIYLGWSMLAALAIIRLLRAAQSWLGPNRRTWLTTGAVAVGLALSVLFGYYEYLLFVDAQTEYIFTYPRHKNPLYWEDPAFPFGSRRLYGAPHRLGWQMVNQWFAQKTLPGDWDSNDDGSNLFWYTLGSPRNPCYPRYYILTQFEQKDSQEQNKPPWPSDNYARIGQVWNHDRLQLELYEFEPVNPGDNETIWSEPVTYNFLVTPADFQSWPYVETTPVIANVLPAPAIFRPAPTALQQIAATYGDPRIEQVRDTVELVGYEVDHSRAKPGGLLVLTLYWRAVEPINLSYKIFAHLEAAAASPQVVAQADDFPNCGAAPTQQWQAGQLVSDRHVIRLPADISPGEYIFQVGLYEPQTGLRMDWLDAMSNPQGNSFALPPAAVKP